MMRFLNKKREFILWGVAVLLFFFIVVYSVFSMQFLVTNLNASLGANLINISPVDTFNLDAVEKLLEYKQRAGGIAP